MKTSKGRIVLYRVAPYDCIGSARPDAVGTTRAAMIVEDWGGQEEGPGCHPNLWVFHDGGNDGQPTMPGVQPIWLTSVPFQPTANGSWFWPPRVEASAPAVAPPDPAAG